MIFLGPTGSCFENILIAVFQKCENFRMNLIEVSKTIQMHANSSEMNRSRCVDVPTYLVHYVEPNSCRDIAHLGRPEYPSGAYALD